MCLHIHLLVAAFIAAGLCAGTKSESFIFGINEMKECLQKDPLTMNCLDQACLARKCLKQGYNLLFENSSYSLNKNNKVSRAAHCAIDKCFTGVMERIDNEAGLFSAWMGPILACLHSVRSCVKNSPKEEL
ncbi:hypothetical protein HF521_004945 [Silurus meridionalis]|uniref:Uncharacterized protein n=1 Tax=Silurus meridionalis TaxID=175797 RepID=A0A8T0AY60_SILME|nr:hypothetical protein HF521_004945 [Silurus meridionalis]